MKILFLIPSLAGGGAERFVVNLAAYLLDKGHGVLVLTIASEAHDRYELDSRASRTALDMAGASRGLGKITSHLARLKAVRNFLREHQPDIAVGLMPYCNIMAVLAATGLPCKVVISERNNPKRKKIPLIWAILRKALYGRANAVTALSYYIKKWLEDHTFARNVIVIPNAVRRPMIDYAPFLPIGDIVPSDRKVLLAAGRIHEQKGYDLLISAFSKIANRHPDWMLVILGEWVDEALGHALQRQAESLGQADRVRMPGRAGNISEWFRRSDIFVVSSRYEGFSYVLLEAMASGCACVSFDCDAGPGDIIRHEIDGLLVPPENINALASAMERLIAGTAFREKLAARAIEARERFSGEKVFGQWEKLFLALTAGA